MPTAWRKVLYSGSDAHITSITASSLPGNVEDNSSLVFRNSSNGTFYTSSAHFTSSNGGQLVLDNMGLNTFTISASGIPDNVNNNAQVLFYNPTSTGFERTSSLFFNTSNDYLEFEGTFSGSFIGDGSGLTGVTATLPNPLYSAGGFISESGTFFEWDGSQRANIKVNVLNNGGLEIANGGVRLDKNLTGSGLQWETEYNKLGILLNGDSNGSSGLKLTDSGLSIKDNINGVGLGFSSNRLFVQTGSDGGLAFDADDRLVLTSSLAGNGLTWATEYTILEVDSDQFITASRTIIFGTGSSNLTLSVSPNQGVVQGGGIIAGVNANPTITYDLNSTLEGDFTFSGSNFTIEGDVYITASNDIALNADQLNIKDKFVLLNSGSSDGNGGFLVQTVVNGNGAFLFYDDTNDRWGVTAKDVLRTIGPSLKIIGTNRGAINTTKITSDNHNTILASSPTFGTDDTNRGGQFVMTTSPDTNESPFYIYS